MDKLFNELWFIQLLMERIEQKNDMLRLFCVNSTCSKAGKLYTNYIIRVRDDSNMTVYEYYYLYNTLCEAAFDLRNVMIEHPPVISANG